MKNNKIKLKVISIILIIGCLITVYMVGSQSLKKEVQETSERPITKLADISQIKKGKQTIAFHDTYSTLDREELTELPNLGTSYDSFSIDLRSYDLSKFDLMNYQNELDNVCFDNNTIWPDKLPEGFDPERIMELGKNPGLGIRSLHKKGITGKRVSIAIIDSLLYLEHEEYKDNIISYELIHSLKEDKSEMHGPMVTSIAAGENTGVAPDAKVYYIANTFGDIYPTPEKNLNYIAEGINRVLEINTHLSEEDKIRVISISTAIEREVKGYEEVYTVIEKAKKEGVFVITVTPEFNYDFALTGLARNVLKDPDDVESYTPGFYSIMSKSKDLLFVPMDARTFAFCTGESDYMFCSRGGLSCTCPWLAGMYALCVQVKPDITPEEFIKTALETGDEIEEKGIIINPVKMIENLN